MFFQWKISTNPFKHNVTKITGFTVSSGPSLPPISEEARIEKKDVKFLRLFWRCLYHSGLGLFYPWLKAVAQYNFLSTYFFSRDSLFGGVLVGSWKKWTWRKFKITFINIVTLSDTIISSQSWRIEYI